MHKAIVLERPGGPEQFKWKEVPIPKPGVGEVLIHHKTIGLNFIDVYHRNGYYQLPEYPAIIGMEGVGVVEAVGPEADYFKTGERVAYAMGPLGAYGQYRTIPVSKLVRLPEGLSPEYAAGVMFKGLTAHYLVRHTFIVNQHHTILIHAAAGGVGLLLCQWAKMLGARVIGTVGSEAKAELAATNGCDYPILYKKENIVERVKEITEGQGVNAVYDSVGKDTFETSLSCLMSFGVFVSYGQTSGPLPLIDSQELMRRGSLFFTRPSLMHYKADYGVYTESMRELFDHVIAGRLKINVGQSYYLSDVAAAHRDLESGQTIGSTILVTA